MASRHRASQDDENIDVMLSCELCMENFDDSFRIPKLLPCHHSFCRQCLNVLADNQQPTLSCPTCRETVTIPAGGVSSFQTNFYVTRLKDFMTQPSVKIKTCRKHRSEEITHFCRLCEVPVCRLCCTKDHTESGGHGIVTIEAAIQEQSAMLAISISETQDCIIQSQKHLQVLNTEMSALFASKEQASADIDKAFDQYIFELNTRRKQMHDQLSHVYNNAHSALADRIQMRKREDTVLTDLIEECEIANKGGVLSDIIAYRAKASSKNREVKLKTNQSIASGKYITFQAGPNQDNLLGVLHDLGELQVNRTLPSVVRFSSQCVIATMVTTLSFTVASAVGEPLSGYPLKVYIKDIYDDDIPSLLQCRGNGRYEVTFRPQVSGAHHIQVKFLETSVLGHQMINVQSNNPVSYLGKEEGRTVEYPRDVSTDMQNNIFIMDTGHGCIQVYDKAGRYVRDIEIDPNNSEISSCGVCVDTRKRQIICAEASHHDSQLSAAQRLIIFSMDGERVQICDLSEFVTQALSVAVLSNGSLVVCDYGCHHIFVFDRLSRLVRKMGGPGKTPGKLQNPTFVCVGEEDRIFVSDSGNHCVQVFSKNGEYLFHFGSKGNGKGQINMPFGLAADNHGNILVVDGVNKRIQIFKQDTGEFVGSIESLADPLCAPRGIAVTTDGYILVADRNNNCIKKFKYLLCSAI